MTGTVVLPSPRAPTDTTTTGPADLIARLDRRIHQLYRTVDAEIPDGDDGDFIDLMNLRCECDPEVNRLVRLLNIAALRDAGAPVRDAA